MYAFPSDLAEQVLDRWETFVARHEIPAPALPTPDDLRHILATAFFASLEREEGRTLRFVLCCAPGVEVLRDGFGDAVPLVPLSPTRPIGVEALRALAPAVSPENAAILVRCPRASEPPGSCEIAGVLHVGSGVARARTGRSFYYRPAPFALMIDVRGAGELHAYQGGVKLASLKAGRYYSSQGPEIRDIEIDGDEVVVRCSPASVVSVVGRGSKSQLQLGDGIEMARLRIKRFAGSWFRVTVIDKAGKKAWSNPIWLD